MGHMKHKTKRNIFRHIQTEETVYVCEVSELAERRLCAQTETKQLEARQVMWSANCALARRLKKGSVYCSAEPMGTHWDEEMTNKWNIEAKHVWTCSNSKMQNWTGKNAVLFKPRQNCWLRGRCNILSADIMANPLLWWWWRLTMWDEVGWMVCHPDH